MASYYFILTGSFFVKFNNPESTREDCKCAKDILFTLRKLSKQHDEIKVCTVPEVDRRLEEEVDEKKAYYNLLSQFYGVAKNYEGKEQNAVVKLAKDKAETWDNVIILNGSNSYEGEFKQENIQVKGEVDTLKFIIQEVSL